MNSVRKGSTFLRRMIVLALGLLTLMSSLNVLSTPVHAASGVAVTVDASDATGRPWLGFGTNWYPEPGSNHGAPTALTTAELNTETARLNYLKPAITRITWSTSDFDPTGQVGQYDWNTTGAQNEFKALDYMKQKGYTVMTGWWATPWVSTSTSYTTVVGDFLNYLITTKGYTNIKYWNAINEPDHRDPTTYSNWVTMTRNTRNVLNSRGLSSVSVLGPDTQDADSWITGASNDLKSVVGGYTKHLYPSGQYDISNGSQESATRSLVNTLDVNDASNKPYLLTEMGSKYGWQSSGDNQPNVTTYGYGVDMADLGVQVVRGGASAPMSWWLDDLGIKTWGMWDSSSQSVLRPWFYTWSLLERYFPAGATIYAPAQPNGLRVLAASVASGSNRHWTFIVVNRSGSSQNMTLRAPGWGSASLNQYTYTSTLSPKDSNGFPIPSNTVTGILDSGVSVTVPDNAVITLTTLDGLAVSSIANSFVDPLNDWSKTYSHTANWTFDGTDANSYFNSDASRAVRTSNSSESIVYSLNGGITDFAAKVYFCCTVSDISNRVTFATSPDASHWTASSSTMTAATSSGANWYWVKFTPSGTLPGGTKYLQITLANDTRVYTPQLAQVRIN